MYHSISDHANPRFKKFTVAPELFAEHMAYLAEHDYTTITVTQFVTALTGTAKRLPDKPVILTFDDGFADFYTHALPILKCYDFTGTLYISTAFVESTSYWLKHVGETTRPMLNWDQLAEISAAGIECGAHSHSHPKLDMLPLDRVREEVERCKQILEEHLAQKVSSFAYPHGYYTAAVKQMVRLTGYTSACAVKYKMSSTVDDPFALSRLLVAVDTDIDEFAALLTERISGKSVFLQARTETWRFMRRMMLRFNGDLG